MQESGSASDAWSSVFSAPAAATTAAATTDVWGASDPFAKQPLGKLGGGVTTVDLCINITEAKSEPAIGRVHDKTQDVHV